MLRPQAGADLGARMAAAFEDAFRAGAARAVLVGTDCPALDADTLHRALDRKSVV